MRPFIVDDAPYEAGLKYLSCELCKVAVGAQAAELRFGCNGWQQALYDITLTFSQAGDIV
jgi:hypothetical protein